MSKNLKFLFGGLLIATLFSWGINLFEINLERFFAAQISEPFQEMAFVKVPKPKKPKIDLEVKSALSLKILKNGRKKILFQKEPEKILPIASLSKLMTAIIVLQDPKDFDLSKKIVISKEAASKENVPIYGNLKAGEVESVETLLDLMILHSSNDAAFALSENIGTENFVEKMNQKAKELGLNNTHFVNPTGLDPEDLRWQKSNSEKFNHSTASDLAKLAKYILDEFPLIYEISSQKPIYPVKNGIFDISLPKDVHLIGGKTGYTEEAGGCMLLVLERKGSYFINVILGAKDAKSRVTEMQKLINGVGI